MDLITPKRYVPANGVKRIKVRGTVDALKAIREFSWWLCDSAGASYIKNPLAPDKIKRGELVVMCPSHLLGQLRLLEGSYAEKAEAEGMFITRAKAKKYGRTTYYTGKLCANGHDSDRRTSDGKCIECEYERNGI